MPTTALGYIVWIQKQHQSLLAVTACQGAAVATIQAADLAWLRSTSELWVCTATACSSIQTVAIVVDAGID